MTSEEKKNSKSLHHHKASGRARLVELGQMFELGNKAALGSTSDFRVPLSSEALAMVEATKPFDRDGHLFPGLRKGVISDMTMEQHMRKADLPYRPHGFRSSFRDWVAERTNALREIAETCLGHVAGSQVERAYRRTDYLDQRREIMDVWSEYVRGWSTNQKATKYG